MAKDRKVRHELPLDVPSILRLAPLAGGEGGPQAGGTRTQQFASSAPSDHRATSVP